MQWIISLFDKSGVFGAILAAMGCASCFPLLGTLGATFGLAFLAQYEGLFINTLLPVFAWITLLANILSFLFHQQWIRLLVGITGPAMVLLSLYPFWQYNWGTYLFYAGLLIMLIAAIRGFISPARKSCSTQKHEETAS